MTVERERTLLQRVGDIRELNVLGFVLVAGVVISFVNPNLHGLQRPGHPATSGILRHPGHRRDVRDHRVRH